MKILGINMPSIPKIGGKKTTSTDNAKGPDARNLIGYTTLNFDGEKNFGELGPAINYELDYESLTVRAWQSYLENDLAKTVIDRYVMWIIGRGLKLQSTPLKLVLEKKGFKFDTEEINRHVEARFKAWSECKESSYNKMSNLNVIAKEAFKSCKVGGDVLVILRYKNKNVNVQVIDTKYLGSNSLCQPVGKNKIEHGVEVDEKGTHVAYWVENKTFEYKRIKAVNPTTGMRVAFLVYGDKYRIGNKRGIPIIGASMETLKKIERYKEAAVGSAEERQKISYFIEHMIGSDGESPLRGVFAKAMNYESDTSGKELPEDDFGKKLADQIAATTNKQTFNMTPGATIKAPDSKMEMFFEEFYSSNANLVCASIGIPPNVAFSLYTDSFSASRAATKDWEHTMRVERDYFRLQFYQPIYEFWLHMQVLESEVSIPGYLQAFGSSDYILLQSYRYSRFTGDQFPHIDPVKEVEAERLKLGKKAENIPLTTVEQATENLNGGDSAENFVRYSDEWKKLVDLEIVSDRDPVDLSEKSNKNGGDSNDNDDSDD